MASIFDKHSELRPGAMATVAERRFADAESLCKTGENAPANGVAYLAGFVIEILLKARLVTKFSMIARKRQHEVLESERELWRLIWKQHDLDAMLFQMRELEMGLEAKGRRDGHDYVGDLKKICATWTIQARYSTKMILMDEARIFLDRVRLLKELLK